MSLDRAAFIRAQTQLSAPSAVPELRLHLAAEVTPLWQSTEDTFAQLNMPPPFWAFAWPGGQGMARYIFDHPELVRGRRVVDFAAGSGIIALAAMKAGAKSALAVDIDRLSLEAIKLNAEANSIELDLTDGLDLKKAYKKADVILAGDICYQQSTATSVTRWLRICVEADIDVYLADPGRAYVPEEGLVQKGNYDIPTSRDLEDQDSRHVTVWKMEKILSSAMSF